MEEYDMNMKSIYHMKKLKRQKKLKVNPAEGEAELAVTLK